MDKTDGLGRESLSLSKGTSFWAPGLREEEEPASPGHHVGWSYLHDTVYPGCLEGRVAMHGFHGGSKCPERLSFLYGVSGGGKPRFHLSMRLPPGPWQGDRVLSLVPVLEVSLKF